MAEITTEKRMESFRRGLNKTLIEKLINVNRELKAKLEYEKELNANCRTQYIELENELERIKKQNTEVGDISESLEVENDKLKAKIETLLNNETGASCSIPKSIIVENQELNFKNVKLNLENEELKYKNSNLRESNKAYSAEISEYHEANAGLKEDNDDIRERMKLLKKENEELKSRIADLEESCGSLNIPMLLMNTQAQRENRIHCFAEKENEELRTRNEKLKNKLKKIKKIVK